MEPSTELVDARKTSYKDLQSSGDEEGLKRGVDCCECGGIGHYKSDFPTAKRKKLKCFLCKGVGHVMSECPNRVREKGNFFLRLNKSNADDDTKEVGHEMVNRVAFITSSKSPMRLDGSDSDDEAEIGSQEAYRVLYNNWTQLSKDKIQLVQEKLSLKAKMDVLEDDSNRKENFYLYSVSQSKTGGDGLLKALQAEYIKEKYKVVVLKSVLNENHKKIRMLNNGSQCLGEIPVVGRMILNTEVWVITVLQALLASQC